MDSDQKRVDIICFFSSLNDASVSRLIDITHTAQAEGAGEIHLLISSLGGRIQSAFTAYQFLHSIDAALFTHNVGTIEAAALLPFLASDRRFASPYSKFMLSSFTWTFHRDSVEFPEAIEAYHSLTHDLKWYVDIFQKRAGDSFAISECLSGPAQALDPEAALKAGIVTDLGRCPPSFPGLAKLWTIHN